MLEGANMCLRVEPLLHAVYDVAGELIVMDVEYCEGLRVPSYQRT